MNSKEESFDLWYTTYCQPLYGTQEENKHLVMVLKSAWRDGFEYCTAVIAYFTTILHQESQGGDTQ